jgi:hypothetical protein
MKETQIKKENTVPYSLYQTGKYAFKDIKTFNFDENVVKYPLHLFALFPEGNLASCFKSLQRLQTL